MLDNDYQDIRSLGAKMADKSLSPLAAKIDEESEIPESVVKELKDNGLMGIFIPEEYGGAGLDEVAYAILVEEISRGCASTGVLLSAHNSLCIAPIINSGNEEQKKKYLPKLATGEYIGCFCLSEPNAGSDAGSLTTFAEDKNDHYLLSGTKNFITNGREAHLAIVFAKTTKTPNHKGISAFIVEMKQAGITIPKLEDKLGIRGSSTAQIFFDKVKVPKENLLGPFEKGFSIAMKTLDGGRIGIAAQAVGIARAAYEYALRYSKTREQFGGPISNLQAIQILIADMSTRLQAARLLTYEAAHCKRKGESYSKQAAQAKLFASEMAMWVTTKAIQICGGNGYTKEYPLERHFRDAKITEIYEGTSEIQRLVIAAHELKEASS